MDKRGGVSGDVTPAQPLDFTDSRYSSHSMGRRYFFLELHSLHAGTMFPETDLPPRAIGTMWSIVSSAGRNFLPQ